MYPLTLDKSFWAGIAKPPIKPQKQKNKKIIVASALGVSAVVGLGILAIYKKSRVENSGFVARDFIQKCKTLTEQNYKLDEKNLANYTFIADLHTHTNHSDGWQSVQNLLDEVANYADKLRINTGKKFSLALTDHDRVSGVIEAMNIIKNNPEKYKNIDFIPGVELSFLFNSNGKIKAGEILAYNINPDSNEIKTLVEGVNKNRKKMLEDCIDKLGSAFSLSEMEGYFINKDGETFAYNLHYRMKNYAQIKNRIIQIAKEQNKDPNKLYKEIMDDYVVKNRVMKPYVSPQGLDEYLKRKNISTSAPIIDENIEKICTEFFPRIEDGKIVCESENSFETIIQAFKNNNEVVLGFAHPYFTAEQMENFEKEFDELLKISKGRIKLTETFHQAYHPNLPKDKIDKINNYLTSKGLISIGGRDNHRYKFF